MRISASATKRLPELQAALVLDPDNYVLRGAPFNSVVKSPKRCNCRLVFCSANDITHEQRNCGLHREYELGTLTGWPLKVAYCNRGYASPPHWASTIV